MSSACGCRGVEASSEADGDRGVARYGFSKGVERGGPFGLSAWGWGLRGEKGDAKAVQVRIAPWPRIRQ